MCLTYLIFLKKTTFSSESSDKEIFPPSFATLIPEIEYMGEGNKNKES